jgi:transposase-like protein
VKNGRAPSLKKRWKCKSCSKTFDKNTGRSFPSTTFPFPFIAYVLYICKDSTLKKTKDYVEFWLKCFKKKNVIICSKETVSISTIYKWRKKYGKNFTNLVSKKTATTYFIKLINKAKNSGNTNQFEIIGFKRELSHMELLDRFKEMAESIGENPLEYMKKYPEIIDLILKQFKIENF